MSQVSLIDGHIDEVNGDLISRSALKKFIENGINNPDKTKRFGHDAVEIITEVHYAPAVDAVEVVRCKDCRYYEIHKPRVLENCERKGYLIPMAPDDFCSYGERRDGE